MDEDDYKFVGLLAFIVFLGNVIVTSIWSIGILQAQEQNQQEIIRLLGQ